MSCKHRFYKDLSPEWDLEHLFIGTFNPEWDNPNGNNAHWFYGRKSSNFWPVLTQVFENPLPFSDLDSVENLKAFQLRHRIGITDLIKEITNADPDNERTLHDVFSFLDERLDSYELDSNVEAIKSLIEKNPRIKGVYATRKSFKPVSSSPISRFWHEVESYCVSKGIHVARLITPSSYGGGVREVYCQWRGCIRR